MHILTKVFVLFASLLAILVAALTISFAINADRITRDYIDARADALAAETALAEQQSQHSVAMSDVQREMDEIVQERASLLGDIQTLEAQIARLTASERNAIASADRLQNQIGQFGETTATYGQIIEGYRGELGRLREQEMGFRQQRAEYEDRISDLTTNIQVLSDQSRSLQEQLAEAQRRVQSEGGTRTASSTSRPDETAAILLDRQVRGQVQGINNGLVQLNLGTNDQVRENTVLYVVRNGSEYIGRLRVVQSDLNNAVAQADIVAPGQQIQQGDQVVSSLARLN